MMTLRQLAEEPATMPTVTGWYLAAIAEGKESEIVGDGAKCAVAKTGKLGIMS